MHPWVEKQGVRKFGWPISGAAVRRFADGWFELDLPEQWTPGVLIADGGDKGTGALPMLPEWQLSTGSPIEVVVRGDGHLRGRVIDAAGVAATGVEVLVWFAEFDDEVGSFISPEPAYSRALEVPLQAGRIPVELLAPPSQGSGTVAIRVVHGGQDLTGTHFIESQHGTLLTERELGRAEAEIEILADTSHEVAIEILSGARLDLSLQGTVKEVDRQALCDRNPWYGEPGNEKQLEAAAARATIQLLRPGRRPERVYHTTNVTGSSAAGKRRTDGWELGSDDLSHAWPAGRFTLQARLPGGREVEVEVELVVGTTTGLVLEF